MKKNIKLLATLLLFVASSSHATTSNPVCFATEIYDSSILEESFSVHEYPGVSWQVDEVNIGANRFSTNRGDRILVLPTFGFKRFIEITAGDGSQFYIVYENRPGARRNALLSYRKSGAESYRALATLDCN